MTPKIYILVTGVPPINCAEEVVQLQRELHELRSSSGITLDDLAKHALQFTEWFDVAVTNRGFSVHRRDTKENFLLVTNVVPGHSQSVLP